MATLEKYQGEKLKAYHDGQKSAYIDVLVMINPEHKHYWNSHYSEFHEIKKFAHLNVQSLLDRLEKAKSVYRAQQAILRVVSQTSVDELIKKD